MKPEKLLPRTFFERVMQRVHEEEREERRHWSDYDFDGPSPLARPEDNWGRMIVDPAISDFLLRWEREHAE